MKTDSQLQQDVLAELKWEPSVHAENIGVEVSDGVVTLAGHVTTYLEKYHAEKAAARVNGVRALAVEIDVKLQSSGVRSDSDIASSAQTALQWLATPLGDKVKVSVEKGWVTLSGETEWQFQKLAAGVAVRYLMGVNGVSNQIVLRPGTQLRSAKTDIEAALVRRAHADASKIQVDIDGSTLTLSGKVSSWGERDTAKEAAWGTPGVTSVIDKMTMSY
jgi:osmotically-inducible protein OsmY